MGARRPLAAVRPWNSVLSFMTNRVGGVQRLRRGIGIAAYALAATADAQSADRLPPVAARSADLPMVMVVPFAQGGSAERVAAIVVESLGEALNRRITTHRVDAGIGVGALNEVAAITPGEIRVGYATSTQLIEATLRNRPAGYSPMSEFEWLGIIGSFGNAVVVGPRESAATFDQWLREVPSRTRRQRWGVGAPSAISTLAAHFLAGSLGIDPEFVTFMSADASYEALRSGDIDASFDGVPNALQEAPRINGRIIAVTSRERVAVLPSVVAFGERWPGEDFSVFAGLVVSAKEPEMVRARLKSGWYGMNRLTAARARLGAIGVTYLGLDSTEAVGYMEGAYLRHARLLTRYGKP